MAADEQAQSPACRALLSALPGRVSLPTSNGYFSSLKSYFSQQEEELSPFCVVTPTNSQDVSTVIHILGAPNSTTRFAIRGGGHTVWAGSANIDNGVTIDMRAINNVAVSDDRTLTSIGGGALWRDVYIKLDSMGLATTGGRAAGVGVGGLTTGGGLSFFSARYGFVCDNVVNFEIVLASGDIVNANATSNSDLWVALRGGSNNFGVVTRFDLRTFQQAPFYGGQVFYNISTVPQQLQAFADFNRGEGYDDYSSLIQSFAYSSGIGFAIQNSIKYTAPTAEKKPATFQPFFDIQPQLGNTMRVSNTTDFTTEQGAFSPDGFRQLYRTTTFKNSLPFLNQVYAFFAATVPAVQHLPGIQWSLTIQPIVPAITSRSASRGGNSLGLDPAQGPLVNCLLTGTWNDTADDALATGTAVSLFDVIESAARQRGLYVPYKYLNYADGGQDVIDGYGAESKQRLQRVSRRYDPRGVFQRLVPGGFKLFTTPGHGRG
ncbi:MAG: hypothetical protein LQ338_001344 [Usnochroma carphineum]|nr:MAG: hypothetical protein LQ338_001344 [Usnochroma carphineum]